MSFHSLEAFFGAATRTSHLRSHLNAETIGLSEYDRMEERRRSPASVRCDIRCEVSSGSLSGILSRNVRQLSAACASVDREVRAVDAALGADSASHYGHELDVLAQEGASLEFAEWLTDLAIAQTCTTIDDEYDRVKAENDWTAQQAALPESTAP
jgi:hypothetical protein